MEYLEGMRWMISGAMLYIMVKHASLAAYYRLRGVSSESTPAHDLKVARCLYAMGNLTRQGLYNDRTVDSLPDIDASLMRLTARGLVERKFVGNGEVPYFELTPDGATILADD